MKLIAFSKILKDESVDQLAQIADECQLDGYDMCIRAGYPITPENALVNLKETVGALQSNGLDIPMITADTDLLSPSDPRSLAIVKAMDNADVRLLKIGYFLFEPNKQDYWSEIDNGRRALEGWQKLGREHNVRICYHVHSHCMLGINCAALCHLIKGFDPELIGAYIDPGHMIIEGEEFATGLAMVKDYLCAIALKDVMAKRQEKNGHGLLNKKWVKAGAGMVDWTSVFSSLGKNKFDGPFSIHMEFDFDKQDSVKILKEEAAYFRGR